jgi:hypothetical protein
MAYDPNRLERIRAKIALLSFAATATACAPTPSYPHVMAVPAPPVYPAPPPPTADGGPADAPPAKPPQ